MFKVRLKVIGGKHDGRTIAVKKNKFLIGREQDCHLRPKTDLISRHHCVFTIDDYGVRLRDLGSRNGTFVNGKRLTEEKKLEHGDQVSFAGLDFWAIIREVEPEELHESTTSLASDEFAAGADPSQQTGEMPMPQFSEGDGSQFQPQPQPQQPGMPMSAEGQPMPPWPGYGMQQPPGGYPQQMPPWGYPQQMPPWGYRGMPGYPPQQYPQYPPQPGYPPQQQQPVEEEPEQEEEAELDVRLPNPEDTGAVEEEPKADDGPAPKREGKTPAEMAAEMLKKGRKRGG